MDVFLLCQQFRINTIFILEIVLATVNIKIYFWLCFFGIVVKFYCLYTVSNVFIVYIISLNFWFDSLPSKENKIKRGKVSKVFMAALKRNIWMKIKCNGNPWIYTMTDCDVRNQNEMWPTSKMHNNWFKSIFAQKPHFDNKKGNSDQKQFVCCK